MPNPLTPSVAIAWLSISRRPPLESYRGVAVNVGGLGAEEKGSQNKLKCGCCLQAVWFDNWQKDDLENFAFTI